MSAVGAEGGRLEAFAAVSAAALKLRLLEGLWPLQVPEGLLGFRV